MEASAPEQDESNPEPVAETETDSATATETASETAAATETETETATAPVAEPAAPAALELPVAALTADAPREASPSRPSFPPPLPTSPSSPPPLPSAVSLPPPATAASNAPLSARLVALQARVEGSIPPRWIEVGRQHPVLWMVVAPVVVAVLFISIIMAFEPERPPASAAAPVASAQAAAPASSVAAAPQSTPAAEESKSAALAGLEGKSPDSLSVDELLLVNSGQAQKKRDDVKALARKLQDQAELVNDATVQAQLLRFAADPDTAADALGAMAHAKAPVGPDLLYEVWSNRALPTTTTELARSLLTSRDVRPGASAALAVAITLRGAETCEAVDAVLPQASSDGDRRSLWLLAKLNSRKGCGEKKNQDCYACLRGHTKQVIAAGEAVKKRAAPSYPR